MRFVCQSPHRHKVNGQDVPCPNSRKARGVRWNEELECFEMKCESCFARRGRHPGGSYWPLTLEFWDPREGLQRCRACIAEDKRNKEKERRQECRQDPARCAALRHYHNDHPAWKRAAA